MGGDDTRVCVDCGADSSGDRCSDCAGRRCRERDAVLLTGSATAVEGLVRSDPRAVGVWIVYELRARLASQAESIDALRARAEAAEGERDRLRPVLEVARRVRTSAFGSQVFAALALSDFAYALAALDVAESAPCEATAPAQAILAPPDVESGQDAVAGDSGDGWIRTSERLPEPLVTVLAFSQDEGDVLAWVCDDLFLTDDERIVRAVTHWRPLPSAPEAGREEPTP